MTTSAAALADKLLPCPFCGSPAEIRNERREIAADAMSGFMHAGHVTDSYAGCTKCSAKHWAPQQFAPINWNTRCSPAMTLELADKLEAICKKMVGQTAFDMRDLLIVGNCAAALRQSPAAPSEMHADPYGSGMTNFIPNRDGTLTRCGNNTNAVLVALFPSVDYDGSPTVARSVSILCVDQDMMDELKAEASRIMQPNTQASGAGTGGG